METENSGESSNSNTESASRAERKSTRGTRQKADDTSGTTKFLRNFDPERSEREKRKLHRRIYQGCKRHTMYNERGVHIRTGIDFCDCLNLSCAGCHFPCSKCGSTKCGHDCRSNRKWTYESIENEGSDVITRNPVVKDY